MLTIVFLKCRPNIPRSSSFAPNLSIFVFAQYFAIRQIKGRWFQIFLKKTQPKNTPNSSGLKLKNFHFFTKVCNKTIPGR